LSLRVLTCFLLSWTLFPSTTPCRSLSVFHYLAQLAEGLALAERDARVADLSREGYAELDLLSRWHGAVGERVVLSVAGVGRLGGTVVRVGTDWLLAEDGTHEWLVRLAAVVEVRGLPERAVDAARRPATARLGLGSVLRSVAADAAAVVVHRTGGETLRARVRRVGADFVELEADDRADPAPGPAPHGGVVVVPWHAIAAVRRA
jgi:hypothetical protein